MKVKSLVAVSTILVLAGVFLLSSALAQQNNASSPSLGETASPLTGLQWVKGNPVQMKEGGVYVVEFWATWCGPCLTSIPHLTQLQRTFKDRNVTVIGISSESLDKVKPFVDKMGDKMDYIVAIDTENAVGNAYMKAFNVRGIPHAFVVNQKGKLVWHGHPMNGMDQVIEEVLEGRFDAKAYAETLASQAQLQADFTQYFKLTTGGDSVAQAREVGDRLVKSDNSAMLNALAWQILTAVPEGKRDLELALAAAARGVKLTDEKNPAILDTYALALYETAKQYIEKAVQYQKRAIEQCADDEQMQKGLKESLERYEAAEVD